MWFKIGTLPLLQELCKDVLQKLSFHLGLVEEQKPLKAEATKPNASIATGAKKSVAIGAISVGQFLKELNTFLDMIGELRKNDLDSFQRGIVHGLISWKVQGGS
jgi:hypothetical protein